MSIAVYFHPTGMTLTKFEEIHKRLADAGHANPPGRLHHSAFGNDDELMVYDVWDSQESFDAFGAVLMPILGDVGVDPGEPSVMPIVLMRQ